MSRDVLLNDNHILNISLNDWHGFSTLVICNLCFCPAVFSETNCGLELCCGDCASVKIKLCILEDFISCNIIRHFKIIFKWYSKKGLWVHFQVNYNKGIVHPNIKVNFWVNYKILRSQTLINCFMKIIYNTDRYCILCLFQNWPAKGCQVPAQREVCVHSTEWTVWCLGRCSNQTLNPERETSRLSSPYTTNDWTLNDSLLADKKKTKHKIEWERERLTNWRSH